MRFRADYTGFRIFFAILSMTLVLTCGVAAKAEPEAPTASPEASQAAPESEPNPSVGASPTEAEAGTENAPADAQTEAGSHGTELPDEDAAAGTDATPPEDAAAGTTPLRMRMLRWVPRHSG